MGSLQAIPVILLTLIVLPRFVPQYAAMERRFLLNLVMTGPKTMKVVILLVMDRSQGGLVQEDLQVVLQHVTQFAGMERYLAQKHVMTEVKIVKDVIVLVLEFYNGSLVFMIFQTNQSVPLFVGMVEFIYQKLATMEAKIPKDATRLVMATPQDGTVQEAPLPHHPLVAPFVGMDWYLVLKHVTTD